MSSCLLCLHCFPSLKFTQKRCPENDIKTHPDKIQIDYYLRFFFPDVNPRYQADHLSRSVALLSLLRATPSFSSVVVFSPSSVSNTVSRPVQRRPGPKTQNPTRCGFLRELPCRTAPVNDSFARRLSWSLFRYFGAGGCLACLLLLCSLSLLSSPSLPPFSLIHRADAAKRAQSRAGAIMESAIIAFSEKDVWKRNLLMGRECPSD